MAVVKRIRPPHMVAIQLKILMPVGTAISALPAAKKNVHIMPHAGGEHVVSPYGKAQQADGDGRSGDEAVAEDGLP